MSSESLYASNGEVLDVPPCGDLFDAPDTLPQNDIPREALEYVVHTESLAAAEPVTVAHAARYADMLTRTLSAELPWRDVEVVTEHSDGASGPRYGSADVDHGRIHDVAERVWIQWMAVRDMPTEAELRAIATLAAEGTTTSVGWLQGNDAYISGMRGCLISIGGCNELLDAADAASQAIHDRLTELGA